MLTIKQYRMHSGNGVVYMPKNAVPILFEKQGVWVMIWCIVNPKDDYSKRVFK